MKMKCSQVLMECLLEQGVDTVFGYPGGTILNIYDEFELHGYGEKIKHILTSHEQGAAHAADGYARSTGKVGVCFATSGPGATNLTTGIATAYYDSSPVVFITVNVPEALIGKDAFQEVDVTGITMPITKCNYLVRDPETLADVVREAFAIARSGRPGPVVIDIAKNVTLTEVDFESLPLSEHAKSGRLGKRLRRSENNLKAPEPDGEDIDTLLTMIGEAKKPLVLAGGGVIRSKDAVPEFIKFIEKLGAPVTTSMMGIGACPCDHPLYTGMIGMHGTRASNIATTKCDLLIIVGCRLSDRVALAPQHFAKKAKIVHIDIDRAEIDKNVKTDHHIIGDARRVLELINAKLPKYDYPEWREEVFAQKTKVAPASSGKATPKEIIDIINKYTDENTIVTTDVGQHQMWVAQYYNFKLPKQLISSGGFGTMGFGLGAAIGAKIANPDKLVIHCTGDGSFRMNYTEYATAKYYDVPIITVLFNNRALGMVRQWQALTAGRRFSQTTLDRGPDFVKFAQAFDFEAVKVSTKEDFDREFAKAVKSGKHYMIECDIETEDLVSPMIPGGAKSDEFLLD